MKNKTRNRIALHSISDRLQICSWAVAALGLLLLTVGCSPDQSRTSETGPLPANQLRTIPAPGDAASLLVVAHRSCWREAPENSIAAMNACISLGVDMLEIDVRKTKDGHLVVIHDETVDRTTNGTGLVAELTLAELRELRLREGAGGPQARITNYSIPLLEEALQELDGRVLINLDAKEAIREMTVAVVQAEGVEDQVVIKAVVSSPDSPMLASASYLESTSFMPIIRPKNGDPAAQIEAFEGELIEAFEIIFESERQLEESCAAAKQLGARCWVNTMWESLSPGHSDDRAIEDPERHWGRLIDLGVNMIQTDRPRELIAYLDSRKNGVSKN